MSGTTDTDTPTPAPDEGAVAGSDASPSDGPAAAGAPPPPITDERVDRVDATEARHLLRRTWQFLAPYRGKFWASCGLIILYTGSILAGPWLVKFGIDKGIAEKNLAHLHLVVALYVVVTVVAYVTNRTQVVLISQVGEGFLRDMRNRVFAHLQDMSMPFYDREKAGVLVSRMTSDVDALQDLVQQGLLQLVSSVLLIIFSAVLLAVVSWQLMLVCLIPVPFVAMATVKFQRDSDRAYLTVRDRIGLTLSSLQEGIAGVRVIQAFTREDVESGRFATTNHNLYDAHMDSVKIQAWYLPVIEFAGLGTTALVIGLGGYLTTRDVVTVGTIAFFVLTLSNLFDPLQQLSQLFTTVQSAGAGLQKLFELLDTPIDMPEDPEAVDLPADGDVEVRHVTFAYGTGDPVLHDVDLTIARGERLALVGPTGAGKSTLAKLIARLYDPTTGVVTFGGLDLRKATHASLRQRITVVPQEGFLFNATILENIRIARPAATDAEVHAALEAVGVLEQFESLAEGLDTEVRERGARLSAGEKQLVSLARAALADPALLVLDEATSSLDPGTEALVESAMDVLMGGRTVVVIAHRLTTAARADRVGVVAGGRLVELGPHDELVAQDGQYARLFEAWTAGLPA